VTQPIDGETHPEQDEIMAEMNPVEEDPEDESDGAQIGQALRATFVVLLFAAGLGGIAWWVMQENEPEAAKAQPVALPSARESASFTVPALQFTDITQQAGITFLHQNGATGEKLLPETMGGGCAFFDYENDGDQDLLLVNSTFWPWDETTAERPHAVLYANDGKGNFTDVTTEAGLDFECYGMGVAAGDFDNDGDTDLFFSAVGNNRLFRNDEGRFTEVTADAGVGGDARAWSTSCGWMDYDRDGDLDLVVANYLKWSREIDLAQDFRLTGIGRAYGPPFSFEGAVPYLYRNEGDGTFVEVGSDTGIHVSNDATDEPLCKTLGVAFVDVNGDGWIDFILANDTVQNLLFINQQDGTFVEQGVEMGIAYNSMGKARGAMGIDVAHFRNDATLGIAIANFANEMTGLYVARNSSDMFTDEAIATGLGPPTRQDLAFGLVFVDADLDGKLDVFTANGHIENEIARVQSNQAYRQPPKLFLNAGNSGDSEFIQYQPEADSGLLKTVVGRGATYADIDGDGDLDLLVTQVAGQPLLIRNDQTTANHYVRLKLVGTQSNRDAIGAVIELKTADAIMSRQVMPTRSYLSQVELPVTIGLGDSAQVEQVLIRWPNGQSQVVRDVAVDSTTTIRQETP